MNKKRLAKPVPIKPANAIRSTKSVADFFQTRKSSRKTKKTIQAEKHDQVEQAVRDNCEDGIEARNINGKGRGAFATKLFKRGDFVVEYAGDLINKNEAKLRERLYATSDTSGSSYMFYFRYQDKSHCVDATADTGRMGRLVNHSRNNTLVTQPASIDGKARLLLFAKCEIKPGTELTLDYGDRSKESLRAHPWLAN